MPKLGKVFFFVCKFLLLAFLFFDLLFLKIISGVVKCVDGRYGRGILALLLAVLLVTVLSCIFKRRSNRYAFAGIALIVSLLYIEISRLIVTHGKLERADLSNFLIMLPLIIIAFGLQKYAQFDIKRETETQPRLPEQQPQGIDGESVLARLLMIKTVGLASITYWNIIVSDQAVYFLQIGTNYLPFGYGAIAEAFYWLGGKHKYKDSPLSYFLSTATQTIKVGKEQLDYIEFSGGLLRKKILLRTAGKIYKFKLSVKKFNLFKNAVKQITP